MQRKVTWAAGFGIQQSAKTRNIGYCAEQSPTVVEGAIHGVVLMIEEHDDEAENNLFGRISKPTIK